MKNLRQLLADAGHAHPYDMIWPWMKWTPADLTDARFTDNTGHATVGVIGRHSVLKLVVALAAEVVRQDAIIERLHALSEDARHPVEKKPRTGTSIGAQQ